MKKMAKIVKMKKINKQLRKEILDMVRADQKMRTSNKRNSDIDRKNTRRIKEIIKQYGWPGRTLVGKTASKGAWLLVQHADLDVSFQKKALRLLEKSVEQKEAEKKNLAYLIDRVCVNSKKWQSFGTQFHIDKKIKFGPYPIKDVKNLNKRRKEFGLESFTIYKRSMQKMYKRF